LRAISTAFYPRFVAKEHHLDMAVRGAHDIGAADNAFRRIVTAHGVKGNTDFLRI
jgi:hypothetical protein